MSPAELRAVKVRAGRLGGQKRAQRLTPARRREIARQGGHGKAEACRQRRDELLRKQREAVEAEAALLQNATQIMCAYRKLKSMSAVPEPDDRSWTVRTVRTEGC